MLIEEADDGTKIYNMTADSFAHNFLVSTYTIKDSTCKLGESDVTILEHFQSVGKGYLLVPIFNLHHEKFTSPNESYLILWIVFGVFMVLFIMIILLIVIYGGNISTNVTKHLFTSINSYII